MTTKNNAGSLQRGRMFSVFEPAPAAIIKIAGCVLAGWMLSTPTASAQQAFAMEFNQANNLFGTVNLLNGSFAQLGSEGGTLFNDIAAAPDGTLYGIVNSSSLVTLNAANGDVLTSESFSVGNIESMAFSPDGILYGATQGSLYTLNTANGQASFIGNFNNSLIGNSGQNIRFAANGNLYDTDGGVNANNTDFHRQRDAVSSGSRNRRFPKD